MLNPQQEQERMDERMEEADKAIRDRLSKIFRKPLEFLTVEDKRFLQARRSYLNDDQSNTYKKVLAEKLPRPDGEPHPEEEEELDKMVRKDLEAMLKNLGIEDTGKKAFPKNEDLVNKIKEIQRENEE